MENILKPPKKEFGGWAIDESEWDWLCLIIKKYDVKSIVEFGTGTSTKLFKQLVTNLVCYEDFKPKFDGLGGCVKIGYAKGQWPTKPLSQAFDFAFMDACSHTIECVIDHSKMIAVHDSKRPSESGIINKLLSTWERIECPDSRRGLSLFIKPQKLTGKSFIESKVEVTAKPPSLSTAFATVVRGKGFEDLFEVFLKSFVAWNDSLTYPFYVFVDPDMVPKKKKLFLEIYPHLIFVEVDKVKYQSFKKTEAKFFIFEAFTLNQYNRVICLDADLLCLKSLDGLLKIDCDIGMARERSRPCFNSGVVSIGKKYLNQETYNALMSADLIPGKFGKDQQILNRYFEGKICELDHRYNTLVSAVGSLQDVVLLHYFLKPNAKARARLKPELIALWEKYERR